MPGSDYCGRCGTSLKLAEASISVQPPRAGKAAKHLRRWFPLLRTYRLARSERMFPTFARWAPTGWAPTAWTTRPDDLVRLILPGWAHWHQGRRIWGWIYFGAFAALVLGGLLLYGTTWGSMLLGLAFGVHSSYVIDASAMTSTRAGGAGSAGGAGGRWARLFRGGFVALALAAVIYFPIGWIAMQVAEPVTVLMDAPPLKAGDVLLTRHFGTPKLGDVVTYDLPYRQIALTQHQYLYIGGRQMDRILAGPGSHALISQKQLYIDGQLSRLQPLSPTLPDALDLIVPDNCVLIVPSTARHGMPNNIAAEYWREFCIVRQDQIVGTIYFRNLPWSRFGRVP